MPKPSVSYECDQDPRYGWVRVTLPEEKENAELLIVIDNNGFKYKAGEIKPTCICSAWSSSECGCSNMIGKWND